MTKSAGSGDSGRAASRRNGAGTVTTASPATPAEQQDGAPGTESIRAGALREAAVEAATASSRRSPSVTAPRPRTRAAAAASPRAAAVRRPRMSADAVVVAVPAADEAPARHLVRPAAGASRGRLHNVLSQAALGVAGLAFLAIVALMLTGHGFRTVLTGSMVPAIPVNSVVMSERTSAGDLRTGDILMFPNPQHADVIMVHRIVSVAHGQNGDVLVRTRGDANNADDPWVLENKPSHAADRVVLTLPWLGYPVLFLRTFLPFILIGALVLGAAGLALRRVWRS